MAFRAKGSLYPLLSKFLTSCVVQCNLWTSSRAYFAWRVLQRQRSAFMMLCLLIDSTILSHRQTFPKLRKTTSAIEWLTL